MFFFTWSLFASFSYFWAVIKTAVQIFLRCFDVRKPASKSCRLREVPHAEGTRFITIGYALGETSISNIGSSSFNMDIDTSAAQTPPPEPPEIWHTSTSQLGYETGIWRSVGAVSKKHVHILIFYFQGWKNFVWDHVHSSTLDSPPKLSTAPPHFRFIAVTIHLYNLTTIILLNCDEPSIILS